MKMKYITIPEPGKVEINETERPVVEKGYALLKVLYGGICGSDLGTYRGSFLYTKYPRIPGHEFSAEIVEVGENDLGLKNGMIVTCNPYFNCTKCYSCERGFVNCCTSNQTMGAQRDGAFMEYITMPIERIYDGKGLTPKKLALIEPFCISYHAAKRAQIQPKDKVLVIGSGTIGCFAVASAKLMGAEVYVTDVSEGKLKFAKQMGADHVFVNNGQEDFKKKVDELTDNKGFDVCIEAVGLPSTFQNAIDGAAFRGRVVVVGIGKKSLDFFYSIIQTKELNIYGSRNALKEDFIELIDIVKSGKVNVEDMVSGVYEIDKAGDAFDDLDKRGSNMLKVMIKF